MFMDTRASPGIVWLTPRSSWRQRYADWPRALRKLEVVDTLVRGITGKAPALRSRRQVDPISRMRETLRSHYSRKREHYGIDLPESIDGELQKLFSSDARYAGNDTAASFLRSHRRELTDIVADWTGTHHYTIDQVLRELIERCRTLGLRLCYSRRETRMQASVLLTVHTMNLLRTRRFELPL